PGEHSPADLCARGVRPSFIGATFAPGSCRLSRLSWAFCFSSPCAPSSSLPEWASRSRRASASKVFSEQFFAVCRNIFGGEAMTDIEEVLTEGPSGGRMPCRPDPTGPAGVDQGLLRRQQLLERAYEHFFDKLYRYCAYRLYNREVAEDVVSEVFMALARSIGRLDDAGEEDIGRWLFGAANNKIITYLRQSKRRARILSNFSRDRASRMGAAADISEPLDWPLVHAAIRQLKPEQQNVVVLRFLEGLELDEIARLTGKRPGTVRVMLSRAISKLSDRLERPFGEE
ncbi:MAG: sigma-70 family RNA polymerase sigma factor, partial [Planctomycetota bacterium]|nr:sigma-70 family RNA polymerase sigma factor [Planctomycetota bacterium]